MDVECVNGTRSGGPASPSRAAKSSCDLLGFEHHHLSRIRGGGRRTDPPDAALAERLDAALLRAFRDRRFAHLARFAAWAAQINARDGGGE